MRTTYPRRLILLPRRLRPAGRRWFRRNPHPWRQRLPDQRVRPAVTNRRGDSGVARPSGETDSHSSLSRLFGRLSPQASRTMKVGMVDAVPGVPTSPSLSAG